ncbi:MAG: aminodeoxychorismate lyase [Actinomycetota bacterium]|nr:aminodeoxychorismate lyase [Actinomycetota bacterium]MDA2950755.1 aminodeoxychorismate lyase [Actinomycetota bacterium]
MLVTLDGEVRDPGEPLLFGDDLAAVRGDGVFETLLVRDGSACLLESHLRRLAHSAVMLDLPAPDPDAWRRAVDTAVRQWAAQTLDEGALRLVYSRGRESGAGPTGYLTVSALPQRVRTSRADGVAAVLLDRGLPAAGVQTMPWLLAGAKTLSYAVNMAALRHAASLGADDVIFVSSDGYVLEGPRSTVVIALAGPDGRPCFLTPPPWYPILRGTTQQALFEVARAAGYDCDYQALRPADLAAAQGVWLVSSITLAARVRALDGRALGPAGLHAEMAALVDAAVISDRR